MATLLGIPKSIALGMVALAPLGAAFTAVGPFAGLVSLSAGNLSALNRRGGALVNSGPYSLSSLMLASAALAFSRTNPPDVVFQLLLLVVFFSGVIQLLLSLLRFGTIAKYIPYPVFSGLMNGSAILLLATQVTPIFNTTPALLMKDPSVLSSPAAFLSAGVAALTVEVYALIRSFNRLSLPPAFLAVVVGTFGFHVASFLWGVPISGLVVGSIPTGLPLPRLDVLSLGHMPGEAWKATAFQVASFATSIALLNSLSSFLAQGFSDALCRERTDPDAELLNQGAGNLLAAVFGGITTAGSSTRTRALWDYGARTWISRVAGGLFALLVLIWAGPLFSPVPLSAMGGVLLILAFGLFDPWLPAQFLAMKRQQRGRREIALNIGISLLVSGVMIAVGMVEAVVTGVVLSVVIFVTMMSRGIIRREFTGLSMRSNTERPRRETDILDREGDAIRVIDLEGYLYFGTADRLLLRTDALLREGARHIILDVRSLKSIDISGLVVIEQALDRCQDRRARLTVASVPLDSPLRERPRLDGLLFDYFDDALAVAEDMMIDGAGGGGTGEEISLSEVDILSELSSVDLSHLEPYLKFQRYPHGARVLTEGEAGDSVFMIARGRADLYTTMSDGLYHCYYRLCRGTVFGEMAMIDGRPRSADVLAEGDLACWVLTIERLNDLRQAHPAIAYRVMTGVSALLSRRLRINLNIISQYRQ